MNPFELVKLSFAALMDRKLRSALTILMVIIGAGLMVSISGLGGGMNNYLDEQLSAFGANLLYISPSAGGAMGPSDGVVGGSIKLTSQTVRSIERIHGIEHAIPYFTDVATLRAGGEERTISVMGIDQSKLKYIIPKISFESGSYVPTEDSTGILLGYNVAYPSDLNKPFARRGQTISVEFSLVEMEGGVEKVVVEKKSFQVKGILNELGTTTDNQAFISLGMANTLFEKDGYYNGIYGITRDPDENEEIEERIRKIYGEKIGITSAKSLTETIGEMLGTFTSFMSAIAVVSMFVGAVGIITTLYTSVIERTREIGLLKAIGYSRGTVLFMFLMESIAIGTIGGILGLVLGIGGAYLLIQMLPFGGGIFTPYFIPIDLVQIFLLAFVLSVIAGLYPAWRASKLSPIVALRKE